MTPGYYLRRALSMPPWEAVRRGLRLLRRRAAEKEAKASAQEASGYLPDYVAAAPLRQLIEAPPAGLLIAQAEARRRLAEQYLAHRFDLLGSGWIDVGLDTEPPGLEGCRYTQPAAVSGGTAAYARNAAEAARIAALLPGSYCRIDWHRDHRSGYRWPAHVWCADIRYGKVPGADVKWPWELGRMQHLPLLALTATPACRDEIRNQLLDFIAANPPGWGVQWACTMDVAIRVANCLIAVDLLSTSGQPLSAADMALIQRSAHEHGRFIFNHLEWNPALRGNHFLCNLAGLAYCAAYLPEDAETNRWLAYALQLLPQEIEAQFAADGGNFEASTCYHRLSLETAIYASAVLDRIAPERIARLVADGINAPGWVHGDPHPLPDDVWKRLRLAIGVTADLMDENGAVPQVGDNDNGRFFKLEPAIADDLSEQMLDHRHVMAIGRELFGNENQAALAAPFSLDGWMTRVLRGAALPPAEPWRPRSFRSFGGLGLHAWRRKEFTLIMRCGSNGQNDFGGHAHNDQLSFTLSAGGKPVVIDAGTYLYTAAPGQRAEFRATAAHNTLHVEGLEQNRAAEDSLFRLLDDARAECQRADADGFAGAQYGFDAPHRREITFEEDVVRIRDHYAGNGKAWLGLLLAPSCRATRMASGGIRIEANTATILIEGELHWDIVPRQYSPAYGRLMPTLGLRAAMPGPAAQWHIRVSAKS